MLHCSVADNTGHDDVWAVDCRDVQAGLPIQARCTQLSVGKYCFGWYSRWRVCCLTSCISMRPILISMLYRSYWWHRWWRGQECFASARLVMRSWCVLSYGRYGMLVCRNWFGRFCCWFSFYPSVPDRLYSSAAVNCSTPCCQRFWWSPSEGIGRTAKLLCPSAQEFVHGFCPDGQVQFFFFPFYLHGYLHCTSIGKHTTHSTVFTIYVSRNWLMECCHSSY